MTASSNVASERLAGLRDILAARGLDGWYVGREDMYQGEEVPAAEERLAFISGFTGSAGFGLILGGSAGLFSDGRYTLQMSNQSDGDHWQCFTLPEAGLGSFLAGEDLEGARIGIDPRLVTVNGYARLAKQLTAAGGSLVAEEENPIDALWHGERPAPPVSRPFRMPCLLYTSPSPRDDL